MVLSCFSPSSAEKRSSTATIPVKHKTYIWQCLRRQVVNYQPLDTIVRKFSNKIDKIQRSGSSKQKNPFWAIMTGFHFSVTLKHRNLIYYYETVGLQILHFAKFTWSFHEIQNRNLMSWLTCIALSKTSVLPPPS